MQEENKKIREKNEILAAKRNGPETPLNKQVGKQKNHEQTMIRQSQALSKYKIKIKVSSGDGNLGSANEMAKRLRKMGYKTRLIDYAPQSNFERNTVYFSKESENQAKHLSAGLGGDTILVPMDAPSEFDLIVVTGKNGFES